MTGPDFLGPAQAQASPARLRARGEVRASFARVGERTEPARVFETGGLRLRFPRAMAGCDILLQTGAQRDRAEVSARAEARSHERRTVWRERLLRRKPGRSRPERAG